MPPCVTEVGDLSRFSHLWKLVAYSGLGARRAQQRRTMRPRGITEADRSIARTVLCEAALQDPDHSKDRRVNEEPLCPGHLALD